ncbi:MAG: Tol-Pal system protein TolB [Chlamydiales bacterium]|nr:Tol-Pal system protein TolB [Chlamydiales bacterium]
MVRFLFALFLLVPLFGADDIVVQLHTKGQLSPLYISEIPEEGSGFTKGYLRQLDHILEFDFRNNGKISLVHKTLERELLGQKENFDCVKWKSLGVTYFIHPTVQNKRFSLYALNGQTGQVKQLNELVLTGDLNRDRKLLHQAHDAAFETLFHEKGIANSRILYTLRTKESSSSESWVTEVWESDLDGANAKKLTNDGYLCVTPISITPAHFLFVSYKIGQPKIYLGSTHGEEPKRVSFLRGNQLMPVLSPQLDKLAFISDVSGNPDLFVQAFSPENGVMGKAQQVFSAPGATQGCPTFSPDGESLAFVSNKDGTARVYMMRIPAPGAHLRDLHPQLISKKNRGNTSPVWSPDGTKLAYSALTSGVRQIWIYDFERGEEWQLTEGKTHKENPTWAPNSQHLLFNTVADGYAELYLINLNQKEATKISSGPGEKRFPSW